MGDASGERTKTNGNGETDRALGLLVRRYGLVILVAFLGSLPGAASSWLLVRAQAAPSDLASKVELVTKDAQTAGTVAVAAGKVADGAQTAVTRLAESHAETARKVAGHDEAITYIRTTLDAINRRLDSMDGRLNRALDRSR